MSTPRRHDTTSRRQDPLYDTSIPTPSHAEHARTLAALVSQARDAEAKVLLVGDHLQRGSVDAGGGFAMLARRGPTAELTSLFRFSRPWEARASLELRRAHLAALDAYEAHGAFTGLTMRTWTHPRGQIDLDAVQALYAPDLGPFLVRTAAISVENTHNFAGGTVLPLADLEALRGWADQVGVRIHLDGARLWNAHVATGNPLAAYARTADVVSVCLSKGLGAPVGSLLVGSADTVAEARVWRKRLGGGMRQIGILAAAGLYALDHHVERLAEDHANAALLAQACGVDPATVDTNIVVLSRPDAPAYVAAAAAEGVLVSAVGAATVRLVTHLDVSRADAERAATVLSRL